MLSRGGRELLENVGRHRVRHRDAVDDQRALGARLRHQIAHFRHRVRAALPALLGAGLVGEIHHQQGGLVGNDGRGLERGRRRQLGGCPLLDHGLRLRAGSRMCNQGHGRDRADQQFAAASSCSILPRDGLMDIIMRRQANSTGRRGKDRAGLRSAARMDNSVGFEWRTSLSQDVPIGATQVSLAQLNERSRDIFRQIVESYLATGEPVGSRNISRLITTPLSPASVRNVMSDLEQLGLVYAPHTSAGRLPTETGLRFFVDALMEIGDLGEADRREMEAKVATAGKSMEAVLNEASGMLSGLTRAAGVVLAAKSNVRLKHIEFVRLEPQRALVVLVADDGQVENRIISVPAGLPASSLTEASNFLNAHVRGRTLAEAKTELEKALAAGTGGARSAHPEDRRRRPCELVGRRQRRAQADRARRGAPARRPQGARGPRAGAAAVRRSRDQARRDRPARAAPSTPRARASSSARRTSCSRSRARPPSSRPTATAPAGSSA